MKKYRLVNSWEYFLFLCNIFSFLCTHGWVHLQYSFTSLVFYCWWEKCKIPQPESHSFAAFIPWLLSWSTAKFSVNAKHTSDFCDHDQFPTERSCWCAPNFSRSFCQFEKQIALTLTGQAVKHNAVWRFISNARKSLYRSNRAQHGLIKMH